MKVLYLAEQFRHGYSAVSCSNPTQLDKWYPDACSRPIRLVFVTEEADQVFLLV
jgi:hypothetical protein